MLRALVGDAGCGATSASAAAFVSALMMSANPDATFPGHSPAENRQRATGPRTARTNY